MVTLYQYGPAWGLPDLSPFCIKVETYLRLAGVPFESAVGDVRKAPKQKLPYIDDDGEVVSDSRDIIAHLEARLDHPLDEGLTDRERATTVAFRALLEEELYFLVVYQRWQLDAGWTRYVPTMKAYVTRVGVPGPIAPFILPLIRKQMVKSLWGQGIGRHTPEQVEARACESVDALSTQLGDGPYFLGERPRTIDATVYAFLAGLLDTPFDSRCKRQALSRGNLREYTDRVRTQYFV